MKHHERATIQNLPLTLKKPHRTGKTESSPICQSADDSLVLGNRSVYFARAGKARLGGKSD